MEGRLFFFVAQRNNQHINVNGVDQLTCGRHQFAPEVLVVTTNHQIHIVFLDCIDQYLAQIAAAAQGFSDWVACIGSKLGQCMMCLFRDAFLHITQIHIDKPGV